MPGRKVLTSKEKCINKVDKVLVSIVQMWKFFPKGRIKRVEGTVFTNFLLIYYKGIDDIIQDTKYQLDKHNIKLGV